MATLSSNEFRTPSIARALDLVTSGEIVSIVGGGGKSALLFELGETLPGFTVLTTTTRIFAAQTARAARTCQIDTPELEEALASRQDGLLVIGAVSGDKAMGVPVEAPGRWLRGEGVDFVVVEADGSRMRPAKAPAEHEPVVPEETTLFVVVAGIDALDAPIAETCHRPERVAALLGVDEEDRLSPESLAALLVHPLAGRKSAPTGRGTRCVVLINKVETPEQWRSARRLAAACQGQAGVERVVLGAVEPSGAAQAEGPNSFEVWLTSRPDSA